MGHTPERGGVCVPSGEHAAACAAAVGRRASPRTSREAAIRRLNDANNDAEEAERAAENLHNQNLDEERRLLRIRQRATTAGDTDADAAHAPRTQAAVRQCPPDRTARTQTRKRARSHPQARLDMPTVSPDQKMAEPAKMVGPQPMTVSVQLELGGTPLLPALK
jgi:hypothetical protein